MRALLTRPTQAAELVRRIRGGHAEAVAVPTPWLLLGLATAATALGVYLLLALYDDEVGSAIVLAGLSWLAALAIALSPVAALLRGITSRPTLEIRADGLYGPAVPTASGRLDWSHVEDLTLGRGYDGRYQLWLAVDEAVVPSWDARLRGRFPGVNRRYRRELTVALPKDLHRASLIAEVATRLAGRAHGGLPGPRTAGRPELLTASARGQDDRLRAILADRDVAVPSSRWWGALTALGVYGVILPLAMAMCLQGVYYLVMAAVSPELLPGPLSDLPFVIGCAIVLALLGVFLFGFGAQFGRAAAYAAIGRPVWTFSPEGLTDATGHQFRRPVPWSETGFAAVRRTGEHGGVDVVALPVRQPERYRRTARWWLRPSVWLARRVGDDEEIRFGAAVCDLSTDELTELIAAAKRRWR